MIKPKRRRIQTTSRHGMLAFTHLEMKTPVTGPPVMWLTVDTKRGQIWMRGDAEFSRDEAIALLRKLNEVMQEWSDETISEEAS